MSGGLFALLDDVAALAKVAAASVDDVAAGAGRASAKAAGVVVDDTAVTPQFMTGSPAARELPIIKKIAIGSLRYKLVFILPAALLLSQFADWALPILLILGGTYLAYEGAEKVWERLSGHPADGHEAEDELTPSGGFTQEHEDRTVANAVRTDFILSSEIMVIALNEVADQGFWSRLVILAAVAVAITLLVYGVVAVIVKMDDVGLHLAQRTSATAQKVGRALVSAMPRVLATISVVGTAAMLWVGGHILLTSTHELGWHAPYDGVHHLEEQVHGGAVGWLVNTGVSAVVGLVVGALVVAAMHLRPGRRAH
jgi:predicted DNA repair protein MutK